MLTAAGTVIMTRGILEVLRQKQLSNLHRSNTSAEHHQREVHNHAEHVKAVLTGRAPSQEVPVEVRLLKDLYYEMCKDYTGDVHTKAPLEMSARSVALWTRVEAARKQAGCEAKKFMRAQFHWFDKAFGTYPSIEQLATDGAVDRALEYTGSVDRRVVGTKKAEVSLADVFKRSEMLVQDVMRAQNCTREQFYERFVMTGLFSLPKAFLDADPVYRTCLTRIT